MKKMLFILLLVPIICIAEEYDANITGTGHWIGDYYHYNANATIRERGYKPAFVLPSGLYEKAAYGSRLPETVGKGINNFFKGYETGLSIKQLKLENQLLEEQLKELQNKRRARELEEQEKTANADNFSKKEINVDDFRTATYIDNLLYEDKKELILYSLRDGNTYYEMVYIKYYPKEYKEFLQKFNGEKNLCWIFDITTATGEIFLDNPYTINEFAQKVKKGYTNIFNFTGLNEFSDIELTRAIITRYPRLKKLVDFPMTK